MDESTINVMELLESSRDAPIPESRIIPPKLPKIDHPKVEKRLITVTGYDSLLPRDVINRTLIKHFSPCGTFAQAYIPKAGGPRGFPSVGEDMAFLCLRGEGLDEKVGKLINGQCGCDVEGCKIVVDKVIVAGPNPNRKPLTRGSYCRPAGFIPFEAILSYDQAVTQTECPAAIISQASVLTKDSHTASELEEKSRKENSLDMYLVLGVVPSCSASDIRKAYRKAALKHHPDKAGQFLTRNETKDERLWKEIGEEVHRDTDKLFKMIGEAYDVLSDPAKRSQYGLEEEMHNAQNRRDGCSTSGAADRDANYPFNSSRRNWREVWSSRRLASASRWYEPNRSNRYPL
ncbi:hypothetical protein AALP_AA8G125300 [Arabis alpina]|uniref:J domain-containing protein n=1 Tax=Arabis alpina TaxID=50452 RepID=A0A087G6L6_ARAAL|nr:hypothetical protein AALP_AA8G125300 [Arabis alpina]